MNYTLKEIAELCGGILAEGSNGDRVFTAVDSDSRRISTSDTLFAALKGDHFDGHSFAPSLCREGGALIDDPKYSSPNSVLVPSVKKALYTLADHRRQREISKLSVLAITGSVGKTTAKNMAALLMASHYSTYKSAGNRNSLTGLPMEVLNVPADCTHAVLEAGMSDPGEIAQISRLIKPSGAVITNVGHSHILAFGSREGICREKLDILEGMAEKSITVPDGDLLVKYCKDMEGAVICSLSDKSREAYADNIEQTENGMSFTACYGGRRTDISIPAFGIHNVMNGLLVFVASVRMGVPEDKAAQAFCSFVAEGNRQNIRVSKGITVIADCYNASPESMEAGLSVLGGMGGKKIAVLGDMLELGEHAEPLHRRVGESAARYADLLICVGEDAAYIADSAVKNGMKSESVYLFPSVDYEKAAQLLMSLLKTGDSVLFKASNRTNIRKILEISAL